MPSGPRLTCHPLNRLLEWGVLSPPLTSTEQRLKEQKDRARQETGLTHVATAGHLAGLVAVLNVLGLEVNLTPEDPTP